MKYSVKDLVDEIENNFDARRARSEALSYSRMRLNPPRCGVTVSAIDARGNGPTRTVGVTVEVSADGSSLAAQYFGISVPAGSWLIPKDDAGEFALYPGHELLEICEEIFAPLSRV